MDDDDDDSSTDEDFDPNAADPEAREGGDEEFDSVEEHVDDVTFISDKSKFSGN